MYSNIPADKAQELYGALVPQSCKATITPVDFAVPDITIPKAYVICNKDLAFPVALQRELSSALGFDTVTISGGYTCFVSVSQRGGRRCDKDFRTVISRTRPLRSIYVDME